MTLLSRVTPSGWYVEGKTPNYSHVTPSGWQSSNWTAASETSSDYLLIPGAGLVPDDSALLIPGYGLVQASGGATITGTGALSSQAATLSGLGVGGLQFARPSADVSDGAWIPSTGSDLFTCIDETSINDADYIYTGSLSACIVALGAVSDPSTDIGHTVRYRAQGNGTTDLVVTLLVGGTTIATWTEANASSSMATYEHALTSDQAADITNYSDLRLRFEAA